MTRLPSQPGRRAFRRFALCAALVLLAQAGSTWLLLDLARRERAARASAQIEQRLGEALSRMDWALLPVLAAEAARWPPDPRPVPAPHPAPAAPFFLACFELGAQDQLWNPRTAPDTADQATLQRLAQRVALADLRAATPAPTPVPWIPAAVDPGASQGNDPSLSQVQTVEQNDAQNFFNRSQQLANVGANAFRANQLPDAVEAGPFTACFLRDRDGGDQLFFLRPVTRGKSTTLQGIWADWPALGSWLLTQVRDLFPGAALHAAYTPGFARRLVSLPAVLDPGPAAPAAPESMSPDPLPLLLSVSWLTVLLALLVVGLALRATTDLSERRGLFVSAVTHELRTPLTTFRMYSQMLADDMVPDPAARQEYLETLRGEADRLTRVVESVLLYARLEDGRQSAHRQSEPATALLDRLLPPLLRRAADARRELLVTRDLAPDAAVHVDRHAVEQILLNLLDNAIKYAPEGPLRLHAQTDRGQLTVTFRDQGPGIARDEAQAVFQPFTRGQREQAGTTPGLGLGLALARGLARALGGELRLLGGDGGATFELSLPLVRA